MTLHYGMLCEGDSDLKALGILIKRIGERLGYTLEIVDAVSVPVSGPISKPSVRLRTTAFLNANVDLGFYFADNDKGEINKPQMIRENIEAINASWFAKSVISVPDPHMEAWLIADQDTVKNKLGISGGDALPYGHQKPKPRLSSLVSSFGADELTVGELRSTLASTMNIDVAMRHNTELANFESNLRTVLNAIKNQS